MLLITLENLFSILPNGVVSKNDIGDLRIFDNMLSWRVWEPYMAAWTNNRVQNKKNTARANPRLAYTLILVIL